MTPSRDGDRRPGGVAPPVPPLRPGEPPLAILVDYDGTIALTDVSDTVMAEHVPAIWESEAAAYDAGLMGSRRLMEIEMGLVDAPGEALLATAAAQPHDPGFVPFVRRAQAAGVVVEVVSDGFGFFIGPALEALGVRRAAGRHGADDVRGPPGLDRLPQRPPDLPRLRDLQAQPRPRPPGGRPGAWSSSATARATATPPGYSDIVWAKRSLVRICLEAGWAVPPLDRVRRDRRVARGDAGGLARGPGDACPGPVARPFFCGPEVWGEGLVDPPPGAWPPQRREPRERASRRRA